MSSGYFRDDDAFLDGQLAILQRRMESLGKDFGADSEEEAEKGRNP